jgi:hypothetical protein
VGGDLCVHVEDGVRAVSDVEPLKSVAQGAEGDAPQQQEQRFADVDVLRRNSFLGLLLTPTGTSLLTRLPAPNFPTCCYWRPVPAAGHRKA